MRRPSPIAGALGALLMLTGCGEGGALPGPAVHLGVAADRVVGRVEPLWRDHYDLSFLHLRHLEDPGFRAALEALQVRSLRCSVGRWEVGHPVPAGGDSDDPAVLARVEREYYRGPNTLAGADDPASYDFGYLDAQLEAITGAGIEPFLCFDTMPLTLASVRRTGTPGDVSQRMPMMTFSNGIRTSPPADPAVYARVVVNTMRHVRGGFAGGRDFGVESFEVGNEPDLYGLRPLQIFWTGTQEQFHAMYQAITAELARHPGFARQVRIGGGSFGMNPTEPSPTFLESFLDHVAAHGLRLDFVSYHSYDDDPRAHTRALARVAVELGRRHLDADIVNGEWGRHLDGPEPIYATVDFGLFRARVLNRMQRFGVRHAHEALLRDPMRSSQFFGMLAQGPTPMKPVSWVYAALNRLRGLPLRLEDSGDCEDCVLAAADEAGGRVSVVYLDGGDGSPAGHPVQLEVTGLDFEGEYSITRRAVTDASCREGLGAVIESQRRGAGAVARLEAPAHPAGSRLLLWEIMGTPRGPARAPPSRQEVRAAALAAGPPPGGDPGADAPELERLRDAFAASSGVVARLPGAANRELQAALERLKGDAERLLVAARDGGRPDVVVATLRAMRSTLGGLAERARALGSPVAQGLEEGLRKLDAQLEDLNRRLTPDGG